MDGIEGKGGIEARSFDPAEAGIPPCWIGNDGIDAGVEANATGIDVLLSDSAPNSPCPSEPVGIGAAGFARSLLASTTSAISP